MRDRVGERERNQQLDGEEMSFEAIVMEEDEEEEGEGRK